MTVVSPFAWPWIASLAVGVGALLLAHLITEVLAGPRAGDPGGARFEFDRRARLRSDVRLYRWCEPLVDALVHAGLFDRGARVGRVQQAMGVLLELPPFTAPEHLAIGALRAVLLALSLGLAVGYGLATFLGGWIWFGVGPAVVLAVTWRRPMLELEARADAVRGRIRARLPFGVDLLTLILQSGGTFAEAVTTLIAQMPGSGLDRQLALVQSEIERGMPRSRALANLGQRLRMDEISDLVFAVRQGEELGVPLSQVLRTQSRQMRQRWSAAVEKQAEESKIRFAGPCTVIMLACMIVILAPWAVALKSAF